jgi:uncharacterized protein
MANDSFKGKWALVTGASSGLGTDFARDLASRGANIILVARRLDRLQAVAQEISKQYGVQTEVIAMDLVAENAAEQLVAQLAAANKPIDILINNAGYGLYGMFIETEWARLNNMLQLDIVALTHLSHVFGKAMAARGSGYILQVASIGAYQPSPTYAAYSAAKSYVFWRGAQF